jgi:2-oxo-4-hydroxy-4-carboxy-5-ureidoimidazoline decarboxylase
MTLSELNEMPAEEAERVFLGCCGSTTWSRAMTSARPFVDFSQLIAESHRVWASLNAADRFEAFTAHPRIGQRGTTGWSAEEQGGVSAASSDVLDRLARGNEEYERRFGFTFLICASGKTAGEMLASLERRLANSHESELSIAAGEQRRITELRLRKLITP